MGRVRPLESRLSRFLADLTRGIMDFHLETVGFSGCYLHDPLAVGLAIDPTFCEIREAFVRITDEGQTIADPHQRPNARVCTQVDAARFVRFFLDRVTG